MILQYASDLHLEFNENKAYLDKYPLQPKGEILILAGDIVPFAIMDKLAGFFSYVSDHFKTTYWIPGNHEYYHYDLGTKRGTFYEHIRSNVILLNNTSIELDDNVLIFSTLWSKINPQHKMQLEQAMNDFRLILYNHHLFTVNQLNDLNIESLSFLENELIKTKNPKKVVITHHVPTFINSPQKYRGSVLHEALGVELSDLITRTGPDYWIYGHIHRNNPDFKIGKTTLLTNQLGYVMKDEQHQFKTDKTITL